MKKITIVLFLLLLSHLSMANLIVDTVISSPNSWDGKPFFYPSGKGKIVIQRIIANSDKSLKDFHCHVVPLAAYVIKGSVEVIKRSGEKKTFYAGDGMIEVFAQWHRGNFTKGTEIIAFYAGSEKYPINVFSGEKFSALCQ